jgi:hypothetical protein
MIKGSADHFMLFCFFYVIVPDNVWLCGLTTCFNFGVLELHVCALPVICDVLR